MSGFGCNLVSSRMSIVSYVLRHVMSKEEPKETKTLSRTMSIVYPRTLIEGDIVFAPRHLNQYNLKTDLPIRNFILNENFINERTHILPSNEPEIKHKETTDTFHLEREQTNDLNI